MHPDDGLKARFCDNPWTYAEIFSGGGVYICCPMWTGGKAIGNIFENSPQEIWNSHQAIAIREGILNGSYDQCDHQKCPFIFGNSLPTYEKMKDHWLGPEMLDVIEHQRVRVSGGPHVVKLGYDISCNLSCPSCRSELVVAKKAEQENLRKIRDEFIIPFLKNARILVLSADGDPFGSNHYRDVMRVTREHLPKLRLSLHTNAVLLDERAWNDCGLDGRTGLIQVSIDAATAETYSVVRRGGDFNRLLSNLEFLSTKRREKAFSRFDLLYVVQTRNFLEMADFVRLGRRLGADSVQFSLIDHWGRGMTDAQYREQKIWGPEHPRHREFLAMLKDPIFREPIVQMNALEMLLDNRQPSEVLVTGKGEIRTARPSPSFQL